jgi:hypothetical protein
LAKLENVKILDMVNGEPTRVEYNGEIYEKTEDEAKAGDLVRVVDDNICDVEEGEFYELYIDEGNDLVFDDDLDDARPYDSWTDKLETFRKDPAQPQPDLVERIAELERRIAALEGRGKRLTVGDYARVIANESEHYAKIGDIVKIIKDDMDEQPYKCELLDGEYVGWFYESELVPVTDEEVAQIKGELRWAKIDRKPGEFKKGDIVRVKGSNAGLPIGTIGEIIGIDNDGDLDVSNGVNSRYHGTYQVELICPVEQRFDREGANA